MRILLQAMAYVSLGMLSACATIVEGSTDDIALSTTPATQSNCSLTNSRATVNTMTPSTVTVKRSKSDLAIACTDPQTGATGNTTLVSDVEAWDFGNIIIGGLIGLGIDWGTGAAYTYPSQAVVPMNAPMVYSAPEPVTVMPEGQAVVPGYLQQPVAQPMVSSPQTVLSPAEADAYSLGGMRPAK